LEGGRWRGPAGRDRFGHPRVPLRGRDHRCGGDQPCAVVLARRAAVARATAHPGGRRCAACRPRSRCRRTGRSPDPAWRARWSDRCSRRSAQPVSPPLRPSATTRRATQQRPRLGTASPPTPPACGGRFRAPSRHRAVTKRRMPAAHRRPDRARVRIARAGRSVPAGRRLRPARRLRRYSLPGRTWRACSSDNTILLGEPIRFSRAGRSAAPGTVSTGANCIQS